ncbi:hypothetical protein ALO80_101586 [Pseudomonas caricapapayae]|uniref:Uncharacterized protein n=1 Tax=Pseudomonas caricapapayae TaxID=46678 RepID=A0A0P9KDK5_9PSED|nr:hypothetical protein ALO80_101586 [Pseudomonas caricapapayae]RMM06824.1 hypothetical protein ALQ84_101384 [Pseudomonas caricapapayae]RMQ98982.1 hypothetical protein ALP93_101166 [Pseudomonas syringae pv. helianthi]RMW00036.1 hypothetical protein ALP01_101031 [Pseudomonas caricapapayae]
MGWDEPVRDPVVCLPHSGRSLGANLEPDQMTGMYEKTCLRGTLKPLTKGRLKITGRASYHSQAGQDAHQGK